MKLLRKTPAAAVKHPQGSYLTGKLGGWMEGHLRHRLLHSRMTIARPGAPWSHQKELQQPRHRGSHGRQAIRMREDAENSAAGDRRVRELRRAGFSLSKDPAHRVRQFQRGRTVRSQRLVILQHSSPEDQSLPRRRHSRGTSYLVLQCRDQSLQRASPAHHH